MLLDNNDFLNFSAKNGNIFSTNVKSILGRNIVLNYIQGMDFELKMFNFSETANDIAGFYEQNKRKGTLSGFYNNEVIKMILEEIQDMPALKKYLYTRIFDLIEQDKIDTLQKIYDDNEKITSKNEQEENKYLYEKRKYQEAIKKIMKEKGVPEETAKIIYENKQLKEKLKKDTKYKDNMSSIMPSIIPIPQDFVDFLDEINFSLPKITEQEYIKMAEDLSDEKLSEEKNLGKNQDIYISDDETLLDKDNFEDENFWN